jgi:hypothetical protein
MKNGAWMRSRGARLGLGLLAVLLVLVTSAGCGRLSKKDYIKKADAICRETNATVAKKPVPKKTDVRATAEYLRENAQLLTDQANRIDALKPPKKDEPRLHDVLNRQRDALAQLTTAANQFQLGDTDVAQATANNADSALTTVKQDLQGYGFKDCAS